MRIDGKDGLMKKIYTGKSLDELKALAISEIKELGVDEADIKITVVEEPVKKLFGKKGDYKIEVEIEVNERSGAANYFCYETEEVEYQVRFVASRVLS